MRRITILGATGSIGRSTLAVIDLHPERYEVFALTAHSRISDLADLVRRNIISPAEARGKAKIPENFPG